MKLHTKYQRLGPSCFRQENFLSFQLKILFLAPATYMCNYAMDPNHLNNFERGPTKDHFCAVLSKSNQWFWRRCRLKKLFTDGQMDEGQNVTTKNWHTVYNG